MLSERTKRERNPHWLILAAAPSGAVARLERPTIGQVVCTFRALRRAGYQIIHTEWRTQ